MADRLARVKNHTRSGFQCTPARQNVACRDVVSQHNRLVVGDQLVRGHGGAAGCVVPEGPEMADNLVVPAGDRSPAPTMPRGKRDFQSWVDVAQGADVVVLTDFHAGEHQDRIGTGGRRRKPGRQ